MCKCIKKMNQTLDRHYNAELSCTTDITGEPLRACVRVESLTGREHKLPVIEATYCPFCGEEYEKQS